MTLGQIKKIPAFVLEYITLLHQASWLRKRQTQISSLLDPCDSKMPVVVVWIPFRFWPPWFGGGVRIMEVYRALSKHCTVHLVGVTAPGGSLSRIKINNQLTAWLVPLSFRYVRLLKKEENRAEGKLHDILLASHYDMIPELAILCKEFNRISDVMICSHPYLHPLIERYAKPQTLIYDAHNVDYNLKKTYFRNPGKNEVAKTYLNQVKQLEQHVCDRSSIILSVSSDDITELMTCYNAPVEKMILVPNAIDTSAIPFIPGRDVQRKYNHMLFIGSDHEPNRESVRFILQNLSPATPHNHYVIAGAVNSSFHDREIPANIRFTGILSPGQKESLYAEVALAINPMFSGSGTNLKVLEFTAAGIPVISTRFGMRGMESLIPGVYLAEKDHFASEISRILDLPRDEIHQKTELARTLVEQNFDSSVVIKPLYDYLYNTYANRH